MLLCLSTPAFNPTLLPVAANRCSPRAQVFSSTQKRWNPPNPTPPPPPQPPLPAGSRPGPLGQPCTPPAAPTAAPPCPLPPGAAQGGAGRGGSSARQLGPSPAPRSPCCGASLPCPLLAAKMRGRLCLGGRRPLPQLHPQATVGTGPRQDASQQGQDALQQTGQAPASPPARGLACGHPHSRSCWRSCPGCTNRGRGQHGWHVSARCLAAWPPRKQALGNRECREGMPSEWTAPLEHMPRPLNAPQA